ncbi:MAG: hypothetical protein JZU65_20945 [Chlorobium sp.]|jgi:hypothetical protein|nr:hypothetical protein [Chlorobium sp.]
MKTYMLLVISLSFLLFFAGNSILLAEEERPAIEIVDIVYEWSPEGTAIQVGDYNILKFGSVWIDNGDEKIVQTNNDSIKTGGLARVSLIRQDENGFWIAERVILLSGTAYDSTLKSLPEIKRNELMKSQDTQKESIQPIPQVNPPVLNNGVWKN